MPIIDQHNRTINYLRLAVTDRCNLRCTYCMPEEGIKYINKSSLLTYEEMLRVVSLLAEEGLTKVRITGGEPFVRNGLMTFLENLVAIEGINQVTLTTNGVLTKAYLPSLKALGINKINLSLDSLDPTVFQNITRRNEFDAVMDCLYTMVDMGFEVKLNCVVMSGKNEADILKLSAFTKQNPVAVRFIEEMPFNGTEGKNANLHWDFVRILEEIKTQYPDIQKLKDEANSTSYNYQIPGHAGSIGIIAAYSRTFCGTCNRIRLTPQGELKTCLYQQKGINIRELLRTEHSNQIVKPILLQNISHRFANGFEAERSGNKFAESMSSIGG